MTYLLNTVYLVALLALSPWLIYKALTTGKYRRGLWCKLTGNVRALLKTTDHGPRTTDQSVWFHGVSVGEIHLLRTIIGAFRRRHPDWQCVVSTTTDTGFEEARKHFPDLPVIWWPFDFSWAVRRALRIVQPSLVVLAEGEIWPNFVLGANRQAVKMAVVNGRMSPRSLARYRLLTPLVRWLFGKLDLCAVQNERYAAAVRSLSAAPERVIVTGSVKYDGANLDRHNPKTEELRRLLNVQPGELIWIAGSTQAPEEEICLAIYQKLRTEYPQLRLILVPRQRERFSEVADLLRLSAIPFTRRSELSPCHPFTLPPCHPILLMDSIGELGALWGLADVAYVGGSLDGRRGGQNMIEPAAYGAAVLFGPHVWNFRETAEQLIEAGAAVPIVDAATLESAVRQLLADPAQRNRLGSAAQRLVQQQQGATERTLDGLDRLLKQSERKFQAA